MNRLIFLLTLIPCCWGSPSFAQFEEDIQRVKQAFDTYVTAWNAKDFKTTRSLTHPNYPQGLGQNVDFRGWYSYDTTKREIQLEVQLLDIFGPIQHNDQRFYSLGMFNFSNGVNKTTGKPFKSKGGIIEYVVLLEGDRTYILPTRLKKGDLVNLKISPEAFTSAVALFRMKKHEWIEEGEEELLRTGLQAYKEWSDALLEDLGKLEPMIASSWKSHFPKTYRDSVLLTEQYIRQSLLTGVLEDAQLYHEEGNTYMWLGYRYLQPGDTSNQNRRMAFSGNLEHLMILEEDGWKMFPPNVSNDRASYMHNMYRRELDAGILPSGLPAEWSFTTAKRKISQRETFTGEIRGREHFGMMKTLEGWVDSLEQTGISEALEQANRFYMDAEAWEDIWKTSLTYKTPRLELTRFERIMGPFTTTKEKRIYFVDLELLLVDVAEDLESKRYRKLYLRVLMFKGKNDQEWIISIAPNVINQKEPNEYFITTVGFELFEIENLGRRFILDSTIY